MTPAAPTATPIRLDYSAEPAAAAKARRRWRAASLVALLPGLVVPFVPFACGRSPAQLVASAGVQLTEAESSSGAVGSGVLGLLAFLAFPLVAWAAFRLRGRGASRAWRAAFGAVGGLAVLAVGGLLGLYLASGMIMSADDAWELALCAASASLLGLTVAVVVPLVVQRRGAEERVAAALAGPYAAIFVLFLVAYADDRQIGWYLALAPAAAPLGELLAVAAFAFRPVPAARPSD